MDELIVFDKVYLTYHTKESETDSVQRPDN